MRKPTLVAIAGGGLAAALALGAAAPALASGSAPSAAATSAVATTSTAANATSDHAKLSRADLVTLDRFFENHPVLGNRLVRRIDAWKTFLASHPAFAARLAHWATLPPKQRHAEEQAWLAKHPVIRHDVHQLRADRRQLRHDLSVLKHDLR